MKLKQMEFVSAARAMGASGWRIMSRHVLRNALAPVLVPITFGIAAGDSHRERPELPGLRRIAAESELGHTAQVGPAGDRRNVVADPVPRPGDLPHRARVQPDRRRPARSDRPAAQAIGTLKGRRSRVQC